MKVVFIINLASGDHRSTTTNRGEDDHSTGIIILMSEPFCLQSFPEIHETEQEDIFLEPPYQVIIHNDDVTPMDFVLQTLANIFKLHGLYALQVMYTAHYHGEAHVQTLPKAEAVKRVGLAHMNARLNNYPLTFTIEPD
jgi:ATP-dependent Clp protease adaptor protein ClpS